ncbi:hypothetical protein [Armatimonas sp.]|uniref:hypothetical protein n=1 Tax=Armatimonas sp. TaxID=1872638 RepID=UPI00286ABF67|nr:hypothetical protein [Armatimonas sp.]
MMNQATKETLRSATRRKASKPAPTTESGISLLPLPERLAIYRQMLTITIPQAGELLGASVTKSYDMARKGALPLVEIPGMGKRMVSVPRLLEIIAKGEGGAE